MIHEYAVEPQLLLDRRMCRLLTESFGIPRGRLISHFPEFWEELVQWALAEAQPAQKAQIVEALARLRDWMLPRRHDWNGAGFEDWLEEAEREDNARPFAAILGASNPRRNPRVLREDDLTDRNPLWKVETNLPVRRTAAEMCECARTLLGFAKEVVLVDYFFEPNEGKWLRPLKMLLGFAWHDRVEAVPRRIELHTQERATADFFRRECDGPLAQIIPVGMPFKVIRWKQHPDLHNRYIMTNRGGIAFQHGLDEGPGSDDVTLLSDTTHTTRWADYQRLSTPFTFVDEFVVVGQKRP